VERKLEFFYFSFSFFKVYRILAVFSSLVIKENHIYVYYFLLSRGKNWLHPYKSKIHGRVKERFPQWFKLAFTRDSDTITERLSYMRVTTGNRSRKRPRMSRISMMIIYLYWPGGQFVHTWKNCATNVWSRRLPSVMCMYTHMCTR